MEAGAGSWDTMTDVRTERLVIFGDRNVGFCGRLLEAFLGELRSRGDVELVALFDTARRAPPGRLWRLAHDALRSAGRFTFNPRRWHPRSGGFRQFDAVARQHGIRPVVPPERNINHPRFVAMLRQQYRPTLAVSLGCLQIFKRELLASFEMAVNFHDGYLPSYQGLRATAWSLYNREAYSGYAWHVMEEGIDMGPILQRGRVAVTPGEAPRPVLSRKLALAARDVGRIVDLMVRRAPGAPQLEPGSYYSRQDRRRLCRLGNPGALTAGEILHRLHAFELLEIELGGELYEVTALREGARSSRLSFTTSDGKVLAPRRCMFRPVWLYRIYRELKARGVLGGHVIISPIWRLSRRRGAGNAGEVPRTRPHLRRLAGRGPVVPRCESVPAGAACFRGQRTWSRPTATCRPFGGDPCDQARASW